MNKKQPSNKTKLIDMSCKQPYRIMDEKYFLLLAKQVRGSIDPATLWPLFRKYPQLTQLMNRLRESLRGACE